MNLRSIMLVGTVLMTTAAVAQDIKLIGSIHQPLKSAQKYTLRGNTQPSRAVSLLKIQLSPLTQKALGQKAEVILNTPNQSAPSSRYPSQVQLGMNGVPVLDQGALGTCVTFANTAAVDAVLNKGNYISQLCQLQLGQYLEKNGYTPSGWDGSSGRIVLNQMQIFGVISNENQKSYGCGGLHVYPQKASDNEINTSVAMTPEDYRQLSESLDEIGIWWTPILDGYVAQLNRVDTNKVLDKVKTSLREGDRVTAGILLVAHDLGFVGAVGTHQLKNDTWLLTTEIVRDLYLRPYFAGHEMVITGYDDEAVAIDFHGVEHKGLLTLRNSWGDGFGNKGDFYMSYDYFKVLVIEAQRIRSATNEA